MTSTATRVRAKFKCTSRTEFEGGASEFKFSAVYSTDPNHENKKFWDATPSASLSMQVKNTAAQIFKVGQEYYLDFIEADAS